MLKEKEADECSVVKNYLTTPIDGKDYEVVLCCLETILAAGF